MLFNRVYGKMMCALLTTMLASCGGGGGGGSSGDGDGGAGVTSGVSIQLLSAASIDAVGFGGSSPPSVNIKIGYSGDVSTLAGTTVYAAIVMPDSLYEPLPIYSINTSNRTIDLALTGNLSGVPEGRYAGTMKVHACLDPACATQLGNSPLSIAYVVEMKAGLKLSTEVLNLSTGFGTPLPPSEVTVTLPVGAVDWSIISAGDGVVKLGNKLIVTPDPFARPGTYSSQTLIQTTAPSLQDPDPAYNYTFQKTLTVNYTVTATSAPYLMNPASASYSLSLNDPSQRHDTAYVVSQDPTGSIALRGFRFDSNPPAAVGHAEVNNWVQYVMGDSLGSYFIIPCGVIPGSPNCLPAGTYTAAMLLRHTSAGGTDTDFEFPVTMVISP